MAELLYCRWRGPEHDGRFPCTSPKLIVGPQGVDATICAGCYCRDHEPVAPAAPQRPPKPRLSIEEMAAMRKK